MRDLGRAACLEVGRRLQRYWRTLGIFLCLESNFYVLRSRGNSSRDLGRGACSEGEGRCQLFWRTLGIFVCLGSIFYALRSRGNTTRDLGRGACSEDERAARTVLADPRDISMPWIQLLRSACDIVGKEYGRGDGTVANDRTATVARTDKVKVGRRLSQECARCDDETSTVARIGAVTVGRRL